MITLHGPNGTPIYIVSSSIVMFTRGTGTATTEVWLSNGRSTFVTEMPSEIRKVLAVNEILDNVGKR